MFPQIEVEWKPGGMALVFDPKDPAVGQVLALAIDRADGVFKVMPGRVAIDIVPRDADKGRALGLFMAHPTFAGRIPSTSATTCRTNPASPPPANFGGFGISVGRPARGVDVILADHDHVWAVLEAWLAGV